MNKERLAQVIRIYTNMRKDVVKKQDFIIPEPEGGEEKDTYIARCVKAIIDEYPQEQALGICYNKWAEK